MPVADIFDQDRLQKVTSIMPQFASVAEPGDEVYMGLEGDPSFPKEWAHNRPSATVMSVDRSNPDDIVVRLQHEDGRQQDVSMLSVRPQDTWEYTDKAFRNVLERQNQAAPAPVDDATYQGTHGGGAEIDKLYQRIQSLEGELERRQAEDVKFRNVMIESFNQMAADVCAIRPDAEFCSVLKNEWTKMTNRSEGQIEAAKEMSSGFFSESDYSESDSDEDDE